MLAPWLPLLPLAGPQIRLGSCELLPPGSQMAPGPRALPASFKVSPLPGLTLLCQAALSLDPCRLWGPLDATQVRPVFLREASASNLRALILG